MKERYEMIQAIVDGLREWEKRDEIGFWEHVEYLETSHLARLNDEELLDIYNETVEGTEEEGEEPSSTAKYPQVKVKLVGEDGNAFAILSRVQQAMRKANLPKEEIDKFHKEATSSDYNHLLCVCMEWVDVR